MDNKRFIAFIVFSLSVMFLWQMWQGQHQPPVTPATSTTAANSSSAPAPAVQQDSSKTLLRGERIRVATDVLDVELDSAGGDIRRAWLPKYGEVHEPGKPFQLLDDGRQHVYITQSGLFGHGLPEYDFRYDNKAGDFRLLDGQNQLTVDFHAALPSGLDVVKTLTFTRGSYVIGVSYRIINRSTAPIKPEAYFRLVRDGKAPPLESKFANKFTGPVVYTEQDKFSTLHFDKIAEGKAEYNKHPDNGWAGLVQHYFAALWLLNDTPAADGSIRSVCKQQGCLLDVKKREGTLLVDGKPHDDLYSVTLRVNVGEIPVGQTRSISMPLFIGPQDSKIFAAAPLKDIAPNLQLTKDYGWVKFLAEPLFWLLQMIQKVITNWGWAIVALTVVIKAAMYPLSAAGYKSMANMKKVAPKMQAIKEQYSEDKLKYQQAIMELYKTEKINPLGGCLPILIQIPVFFALYSVLLSAVELRQAPFMLWITDLSSPDPYYVLPVLMAVTMYLQTFLNPPPADPMQAKMMKVMPIAFSVFFFFFPVGLVIYYLVNNLLSMAQQWYVNKKYA